MVDSTYVDGWGEPLHHAVPEDAVETPFMQLRRRSDRSSLPRAIRNAETLPFPALGPEVFERAVAEIVARRDDSSVHFYGRRGQKQFGLDIYEEQADGARVLYQVKRYQSSEAKQLRAAVEDWAGEPARDPYGKGFRRFHADRFVIVTSAPIDIDTAITDEIAALQHDYRGDVRIDVWGAEALSARLREAPALVAALFGRQWANEFCGTQATQRAIKDERALLAAEECLDKAAAAQYTSDDKIKFRQIDLVGISVDRLFIDVPVRADRGSSTEATLAAINPHGSQDVSARPLAGAVQALLHPSWARSTVVVGGPGQGKSTLLQYICQYHRARGSGRDSYLPEDLGLRDVSDVVRTPLKVELTEYAQWRRERLELLARDRSRRDRRDRPTVPYPSLESYLIALVERLGEGRFGSKGLTHVLKLRPMLLAFDGLDEIADSTERADVADEIRTTESRLRSLRSDTLILLATRPGTVGNPIWRDHDFATLFLQRLTPALRMTYFERWVTTVDLEVGEVVELRTSFESSINRPHVSELAGNPMQLAILLHLVHKIPSLPEKRTKLYESYIDIFIQRESKVAVIRDNRDYIIQFHRLLAWYIHANIELKRSNGTIGYDDLEAVLTAYLTPRGKSPDVIAEIFNSFTQRVLCLTEREAGSREYAFDVQPLREYFASAYIYEMAPDNTEDNVHQAILSALLPRQYWANVLRFFAGGLRSGEIANIGYALDAVATDATFGHHPGPRVVARLLLEDQVFAGQHQVVTRDIVEKILRGPGVQLGLDGLLQQDDQVLEFPEGLPRDSATSYLATRSLDPDPAVALPAAQMLRTLGLHTMVPPAALEDATLSPRDHLLRLAALGHLAAPGRAVTELADGLAAQLSPGDRVLTHLLADDCHAGGPALLQHCAAELASGVTPAQTGPRSGATTPLERLSSHATADRLHEQVAPISDHPDRTSTAAATVRPPAKPAQRRRRTRAGQPATIVDALEHAQQLGGEHQSAAPWRTTLNTLQEIWGVGAWPVREAVRAAPEPLRIQLSSGRRSLRSDAEWPRVAAWLREAHEQRDNLGWWRRELPGRRDHMARATFVFYLLTTASSAVIVELVDELDGVVDGCDVSAGTLAGALSRFRAHNVARPEVRLADALRRSTISPTPRVAALLWRVTGETSRVHLAKQIRSNPAQLWGEGADVTKAALEALTQATTKVKWKSLEGSRQDIPAGILQAAQLGAMTPSECQAILAEPDRWPTDVVRAATDRLSKALDILTPVAWVARDGGWTGPDGDLVGAYPPTPKERPRRRAPSPRLPRPAPQRAARATRRPPTGTE